MSVFEKVSTFFIEALILDLHLKQKHITCESMLREHVHKENQSKKAVYCTQIIVYLFQKSYVLHYDNVISMWSPETTRRLMT